MGSALKKVAEVLGKEHHHVWSPFLAEEEIKEETLHAQ